MIRVWINGWVNNREAGDWRRHRAYYDATVMYLWTSCQCDKVVSTMALSFLVAANLSKFSHSDVIHYSDVIMSGMASQMPVSGLFTQPFVQAHIKENIEALHHCPLWGNSPVTSEFPHKWPVTRKMLRFDDVITWLFCHNGLNSCRFLASGYLIGPWPADFYLELFENYLLELDYWAQVGGLSSCLLLPSTQSSGFIQCQISTRALGALVELVTLVD